MLISIYISSAIEGLNIQLDFYLMYCQAFDLKGRAV